jgi:hypothetical protein
MSIQSIGASTSGVAPIAGTTPTTMTSPPPSPHLDGTLDGIAGMLSMSPAALRSALKQGSSITDLAQQQGVSRDDLVKSVESQIQQRRQADGQQPLDQTALDHMVNRAFDRHRGGHHHHQHATSATSSTQTDQSTAATGGIDVSA